MCVILGIFWHALDARLLNMEAAIHGSSYTWKQLCMEAAIYGDSRTLDARLFRQQPVFDLLRVLLSVFQLLPKRLDCLIQRELLVHDALAIVEEVRLVGFQLLGLTCQHILPSANRGAPCARDAGRFPVFLGFRV